MPKRVPLPTSLVLPFTISDARQAGLGYGRTRSADLAAPFHGVRTTAHLPVHSTPEGRVRDRARTYAPRLGAGQFFCNTTAIAIHGLPLPGLVVNNPDVHVGTPPPRTAPRTAGVVGHQLVASTVIVDSMPVCGAVHAWMQSAATLSVDDLIIIGDALVRRQAPLSTLEYLQRSVGLWSGRPGAVALRLALVLVRARTDSPPETALRLIIVRSGLPEPVINDPVMGRHGEFLGFGDLVYPKWKVVIEYDGGYHFLNDRQIHLDIDRLARFTASGWTVIRIHKFHLASPSSIVGKVAEALYTAGWRPAEG